VEAGPGGSPGRPAERLSLLPDRKVGSGWVTTEGVRGVRYELGAWSKTPSPGDFARRSHDQGSARTARGPIQADVRGHGPERFDLEGCSHAEAGGSPSSEAPPEGLLEAFGGRRVGTKQRVARLDAVCARESGSPQGARIVSRLQKLVRRIFLVERRSLGNRRRS